MGLILKIKQIKRLSFIFSTFFPLFSGWVWATQTNYGEVGEVRASFLDITPSVKLAALGGHQAGLADGVNSLYTNPAGLIRQPIPVLFLSHNESIMSTRYENVGFAVPLRTQALGVSFQYIGDGSAARVGVDESDNPVMGLGDFRFSTYVGQMGWARKLTRDTSVGAGLKAWGERRDTQSSMGWASDVGVQFRSILPSVDLGIVARNLGPAYEGHSLPTSYALGLACHIPHPALPFKKTTIFSEVDHASYRDNALRIGIESGNDLVRFRGGYQTLTQEMEEPLSQFSFGAGLRLKEWTVDYAWLSKDIMGDEHRISLSIGFGLTPEEREQWAKNLDAAIERRMVAKGDNAFSDGKKAMADGRYENAAASFEAALKWNPRHSEASEQLKAALMLLNMQQASEAYHRAEKLLNQGQHLEAAFYCREALQKNPAHEKARELLNKSQEIVARESAISEKKALSAESRFNTGLQAYLAGDHDKAARIWENLLLDYPGNPYLKSYIDKARIMSLEKEVSGLRQGQDRSKELERLNHKAYTLYTLKQTEEAIRVWEDILRLDPRNKDAEKSLSEARTRLTLTDGHESSSGRRDVKELNTQALKAYSMGDAQKAIMLWRKALMLEPQNIWVRSNLERVEKEWSANAN